MNYIAASVLPIKDVTGNVNQSACTNQSHRFVMILINGNKARRCVYCTYTIELR
jgi:sarcosine oxidase gamma subunit